MLALGFAVGSSSVAALAPSQPRARTLRHTTGASGSVEYPSLDLAEVARTVRATLAGPAAAAHQSADPAQNWAS
jgi:hypothetical protein